MKKNITKENFDREVLHSSIPVVVDFYANWCVPCRMLAPMIEELENEYSGRLKVCTVDVEDQQELVGRYRVASIPTLILFSGGIEERRSYGYKTHRQLREFLNIPMREEVHA